VGRPHPKVLLLGVTEPEPHSSPSDPSPSSSGLLASTLHSQSKAVLLELQAGPACQHLVTTVIALRPSSMAQAAGTLSTGHHVASRPLQVHQSACLTRPGSTALHLHAGGGTAS
jgi:hypothetical protein